MRVSVKNLLLALYLLIILVPVHYSNSIIKMCNNLLALIVLVFLVKHKYRPNSYTLLVGLFYVDLILMTLVNGNITPNIVVYNIKLVVFVACVHYMYQKKPFDTMRIVFNIIFIYVLVDFITIVLFPDGLYTTVTEYSQWNSVLVPNWFLGNKNNRVEWSIIAICLAQLNYAYNQIRKRTLYLVMIVCLCAVILTKSSTSMVAVAFLCAVVLFYKKINVKIGWKIWLSVYALFLTLVMAGNVGFLAPIVEGLLGKELTFTGRSNTWMIVLGYIYQKPISGWGYITSDRAVQMISKSAAVNAHSQWLQILLQGGVIQFLLFVAIIYLYVKRVNDLKNQSVFFYMGSLFTVFLVMTFEVIMGYHALLFFLFMIEGIHHENIMKQSPI